MILFGDSLISQSLSIDEAKRKLVSIQRIKEIKEHKNADSLELATVLGWQVVVKKSEFKVGDLVVFMEIDSFLPSLDKYSFIGKLNTDMSGKKGYKLKTAKFRDEISQGLITPIKLHKELDGLVLSEGDDVTKLLNVSKWWYPEVQSDYGKMVGSFPTYLTSKSDEVRIQSVPNLLEDLEGRPYYSSVKYDGFSVTIIKKGNKIMVCTRNNILDLSDDSSIVINTFKESGILDKVLRYDKDITLKGEFYGSKICKNPLKVEGKKWAIYTIEYNRKMYDLLRNIEILRELDLDFVELDEIGGLRSSKDVEIVNKAVEDGVIKLNKPIKDELFNKRIEELLDDAKGYYTGTKNNREGIVIRPVYTDDGKETSFKVINNDYL